MVIAILFNLYFVLDNHNLNLFAFKEGKKYAANTIIGTRNKKQEKL